VTVQLIRGGNAVGATIGPDLQIGISGWGATAAEALLELANAIERENWPLPEQLTGISACRPAGFVNRVARTGQSPRDETVFNLQRITPPCEG
jgi:hypothetical protein